MDFHIVRLSLILGLMGATSAFATDMYLPALPLLARDLQSPISAAQFTLTAFFIAFGLTQLFYGPASDIYGRKKPIYFGLGLFVVASIGCAFAPNIETLIALRFLQGIGAAAPLSIARAIIRDLYTGQKATRMMSTFVIVLSISPMLAPLLGSVIIVPFGWRAVFWSMALAAGLSILLVRFSLVETHSPARRIRANLKSTYKSFGILLCDPYFLRMTLMGGFGRAAFFTYLGSASFVYMNYFSLSPTQFSLAFALNALGFFVSSQFAANLLAKFGPEKLLRFAALAYAFMMASAFSLFLFGFGSLYLLIALFFIAFSFMGIVLPITMVLALDNHGQIAGTASSLSGTMHILLGALAMTLSGLVFDGTPVPMLAIIALCGVGVFALSRLNIRPPLPSTAQ